MIELPPDATFVIQIVSFLILWQLMRWALFTPIQRILAERAAWTSGTIARADALRAEAQTLETEMETAVRAARLEGLREGEEIRRQCEAEEQQIVARSRAEAMALFERERATTNAQVEAARGPLRAEAERLAQIVVEKVLERRA